MTWLGRLVGRCFGQHPALAVAGIVLAVLSVLGFGAVMTLPVWVADFAVSSQVYSRQVPFSSLPVECDEGLCTVNISALGLVSLADTPRTPTRSPLVVLENGQRLSPHARAEELMARKPGVFRHWQGHIYTRNDNLVDSQFKDVLEIIPLDPESTVDAFTLEVPATAADAYALTKSQAFSNIKHKAFITLGIAFLLGSTLIITYGRGMPPWTYQLPLLVALGGAYALLTAVAIIEVQPGRPPGAYTYLNTFSVSPDSASYYTGWQPGSSRGPGYPLFIKAVADPFTPGVVLDTTKIGVWNNAPDHPLLRVSQTQILILLGAGLVLCAVLMLITGSPLPVLLFVYFQTAHFYVWYELNFILTEPLSQALLLLTVACSLLGFYKRWIWTVYACALCFAFAYVVRQAMAFAVVFVALTALAALWNNWRRNLKHVALAALVSGIVVLSPDIYSLVKTGQSAQATLSYQYKIVYALRLAVPEDIDRLPTQEMRDWLQDALARRDAEDRRYDTQIPESNPYLRLVYRIQSAYFVSCTNPTERKSPAFYLDLSKELMRYHRLDYLRFGFNFCKVTLFGSQVDRITWGGIPSWAIYLAAFGLMGLLRNRTSLAALTLIAGHWLHILTCSMFAAPIQRMVYLSDVLVLLALLLLVLDVVRLVGSWVAKNVEGNASKAHIRANERESPTP